MTEVTIPSHSEPDKTYDLIVQDPSDVDEVICECDGFLYRGRCSHQQEALDTICGWTDLDDEVQTREQRRNKICPRCGGPTEWIMEDMDADC